MTEIIWHEIAYLGNNCPLAESSHWKVPMRATVTRLLVAVALALGPIGIIYYLKGHVDEIDLPDVIEPGAATYAAGVERLGSISQSLITISLSIIAAVVYLVIKLKIKRVIMSYLIAYLVFIFNMISIFFAVRLGYSSGVSLGSGAGDIVILGELLDYQSISLLFSAGGLIALAVMEGDSDVKT